MADAKIAAKQPTSVKLEAGKTYFWCRCGESRAQPMCDGSHRGSLFSPLAFTVNATEEAWLCQCKRSKTPPYCDGTHKTL